MVKQLKISDLNMSADPDDSTHFARTLIHSVMKSRLESGINTHMKAVAVDDKCGIRDHEKFVQENWSEKYTVYSLHHSMDIFFFEDGNIMVICSQDMDNFAYNDGQTAIHLYGSKEFVFAFDKFKKVKNDEHVYLTWYYTNQHGINAKSIELTGAAPMYDEYCPFVNGGVEHFLNRYMESSASILILLGPPGTGKTSFIRHFIYTRGIPTCVTFDEKVMNSDSYFLDYLTGTSNQLMVVEDADVLLASRESDANKIMSKLLNVSDGLVPLLKKKMIFSTNLDNMHKIDPAIMRPGRCFDTVHFRQLSYTEAVAACDRAGIERVLERDQEYTLSEIFNGKNTQQKRKRVGF